MRRFCKSILLEAQDTCDIPVLMRFDGMLLAHTKEKHLEA